MFFKRSINIFWLLSLILLMAGCTPPSSWSRYEVCFGLSADTGKTRISDAQWQEFRDQEIAVRFPDGFTVYRAEGHWSSGGETYDESSQVLMVVAPDTDDTQKKLDAIAKAYVRRFRQDAVLLIKSDAKVRFIKAAEPEPAR
jgi:hypothetical protein